MSLHELSLFLTFSYQYLHGRVSGEFCSRHTSSLRQSVEMPSLAGPKSRAHLASFARLDDGAFCRVISASFKLWAPPTYASREEQSCTQTSGAAGAWYGQLAPALPLAARVPFFLSRLTIDRTPVLPIVLDRHTYTWPAAICLAGRSPGEIDFPPRNCRSGGRCR